MTKRKGNPSQATEHDGELSPALRVRAQADQLYRTATECVRQRERYAKLVAGSADDGELQATKQIASLCDEMLSKAARTYEKTVAEGGAAVKEPWWHCANTLWHASREYERRHRESETQSRKLNAHSASKLTELALQYDLEASALLALDHALASYRKCCPETEHAPAPAKGARAS